MNCIKGQRCRDMISKSDPGLRLRRVRFLGQLFSLLVATCPGPLLAQAQQYKVDRSDADRDYAGVEVVQLREDSFSSSPDGRSPPSHSSVIVNDPGPWIGDGVYTSAYHGYRIKIPRVAGSAKINVHQALISRRADGTPITSHVLFLPEGSYGAAALVVTRLRDDRPKDPEFIVSQFETRSPQEAEQLESEGVFIKRFTGPWGPCVQRTIRNQVFSWHYPYRVRTDLSANTETVGISRFVVLGEFLLEFGLITRRADNQTFDQLRASAEHALDTFMGALIKDPE